MKIKESAYMKGTEIREIIAMPPAISPVRNQSETDTQFAAQQISDAHERMIRQRILGAHRQRNVININLRTR